MQLTYADRMIFSFMLVGFASMLVVIAIHTHINQWLA